MASSNPHCLQQLQVLRDALAINRKRPRCSEGLCQPAQHHILPQEARKLPSRPRGHLLFLWGRKRK